MIEGVSERFNLETYLSARKVAMKACLLFAQHVEVGMNCDDMDGLVEEIFKLLKIEKKWHISKLRVGKDTVKTFKEKSDVGLKLKEEDIYFIDIGPVIDGHEADFGMTFTKGQNSDFAKIQKASKDLFEIGKKSWKEENLTGEQLYNFISSKASDMGYVLDSKMQGHRLGDFPHHVHYRGSLGEHSKKPIENLWVLEIKISHPNKEFGAFYEDILF